MQKICKMCHRIFDTDNKKLSYCKECKPIRNKEVRKKSQENWKKKQNRKPKKKISSLDLACREVVKYNKEHDTKLSYGKYFALKRQGKL